MGISTFNSKSSKLSKQSQPLVVYIVLMFYAMFYATNIIIGRRVVLQQFYLRHPFPLPLKNLNIYFQLFTISLSHSIVWFQCSLIFFFFFFYNFLIIYFDLVFSPP